MGGGGAGKDSMALIGRGKLLETGGTGGPTSADVQAAILPRIVRHAHQLGGPAARSSAAANKTADHGNGDAGRSVATDLRISFGGPGGGNLLRNRQILSGLTI